MCSAQREVSRDGAARGGFRATVHKSKLLEQTFSGIIGSTKYASAGENRREAQKTRQKQKREALVSETEE